MANNLSVPSLTVSGGVSARYQTMGVGETDRLMLLGHADGIGLNDPYPVGSMQDALDALGRDTTSPLLRALLEAYFAGGRDIWITASAPMSEYEPDLTARDAAYYTTYRNRLNTTYDLLKEWGVADITIPVDAPFNSTVDFLGPLATYCVDAFNITGSIHLGMLGTRGVIDADDVTAMAADGRLGALGDAGKFIGVFAGDVALSFREIELSHNSSVVVSVAALMSQLPWDQGVIYKPMRNVLNLLGKELTAAQKQTLAEAGINPLGKTSKGRRGELYQVVAVTDNTLAQEGSDFWSLNQMRLITQVTSDIRGLGNRRLGTVGYDLFRHEVQQYLARLVASSTIRSFDMQIARDVVDRNKVLVHLSIMPFFGVREITATIEVGPNEV